MADYTLVYDNTPLIRFSDGLYPVYFPFVRKENSNTSFPIPFRDTLLADFGFGPVFPTQKPEGDIIEEGLPEKREDGKYYQVWIPRDFTEQEKAERLATAKEDLLRNASNKAAMDLGIGIDYEYKGQNYLISVGQDQMTLLLAMKSVAKDSAEDAIFTYSFQGEQVVDMTRDEFLLMLKSVFEVIYNTNKNFWKFRESVVGVQSISELPDLPETFK